MLRRVLLLWLFMFWQGGFLFYGAVVVTVGSEVLGDDFQQGLITREVTRCLNAIGLIVLLAWLGDLIVERQTRLGRRCIAWLLLLLLLAVLAWMHPRMEALMGADHVQSGFRTLHRWYLRVSTMQWIVAITFTFWTLQNWRATDQRNKPQMNTDEHG